MRAAIYARYSTDKQTESSVADQLRVCTEYAEREGFTVAITFRDEGISGAAIGNRPGFIAMMEAANAHQFDVLLLMDLSRLSRSQGDLAKTIDRLRFTGIRVVALQDGYDSDRKGHKMQAGLSGIIGEAFREMVADKTYAALESRAKTKRAVGGCPYGYNTVHNKHDGTKWLAVEPAEADIVRRIFTMYAEGMGGKQIAVTLNEERVTSPAQHWKRAKRRGWGAWHPSAIVGDPKKAVGIINNETYRGRLIWNRSKWTKDPDSGRRTRRSLPRSAWIITDAADLRIVDDELWEAVQARIRATQERTGKARERAAEAIAQGRKRRKRTGGYAGVASTRPGRPAPYLLSGLLKCGTCGSNFIMADGRKYGCATRINCGTAMCNNGVRVSRTDAEELLLQSLRDELLNGEYLKLWTDEVDRQVRGARNEPNPGNSLRSRLAKVEASIERVVDALASGLEDHEEVLTKLKELKAEKTQLLAQLQALADPTPVDIAGTLRGCAADFARMVDELPGHLTDPSVVYEARDAVRSWVGDVRIEPSEDGPLAFWRLNAEGLLVTAGPRVANVVAGGRSGRLLAKSAWTDPAHERGRGLYGTGPRIGRLSQRYFA